MRYSPGSAQSSASSAQAPEVTIQNPTYLVNVSLTRSLHRALSYIVHLLSLAMSLHKCAGKSSIPRPTNMTYP